MRPAAAPPRHEALCAGHGRRPSAARLTDRQRLAVVLQAAGLLSHLEHAGWRLRRGWTGAEVDERGRLCSVAAAPGRPAAPPQSRLRELLLALFGGTRSVAGRGQARRAARRLLEDWAQELTALPVDRALRQVFEAAPFLWRPEFGTARRSLAAEHRRRNRRHLWVAGPGGFRRRVLAEAPELERARELLAGGEARRLWEAATRGIPATELAAAGRWRAAVAAWRAEPPTGPAERLELAQACFALGRFEEALTALHKLRSVEARVLRARCLSQLGRFAAARRAVERLAAAPPDGRRLLEAAELAVRVYGNLGDARRSASWVERAQEAGADSAELAARAQLLAAEAAWDRGDPVAMEQHLEASLPALDEPELAWRWHHVRGLQAMQVGDGGAMEASLGRALAGHRRRLRPFEAAGLWNELGIGRAMRGELAAAERAFGHAVRLLTDVDGRRSTTLALFNLAEIRLRRGRLDGVREILERTSSENRQAGNRRGLIQDAELWARWELVRGRPAAALERLDEAFELQERHRLSWHREVLELLAARALGWLERGTEARERLVELPAKTLVQVEPEERPALWAHGGDRERALEEAVEGPLAGLWRLLLTGRSPAAGWRALEQIEPYRAARFVFDAELLAPGAVPPFWVRRAVAVLRRVGADAIAERLEGRGAGPWRALERYLSGAAETGGGERLAALFSEGGYPEARLSWWDGAREHLLVDGAGGGEELSAPLDGGRLVLRAPLVDRTLRSFFALARRETRPPGRRRRPAAGFGGGIVGRSPALAAAMERLSKLAPRDLPILVRGETGTGKELVARRIHALSERAPETFLPVNCAALSESLLLSDLFGHVRGAFTGAERDRAGIFETARGGTVFLDEIGDLPLPAQGKLLRVLQEGEVRRVGESLPRRVDVRVVAATHRDLAAMTAEGGFRRDLYYRLKVGSVELPPLRDRGDDVLLLAEHFLARQDPGGGPRLSAAARRSLAAYRWPGNVRELKAVLSVAAALADGGRIETEDLDLPYAPEAPAGDYHQQVDDLRRRLVEEALAAAAGNRAAAARLLGLSRQALSYLVRKLELD